jgi:hypothetical protein
LAQRLITSLGFVKEPAPESQKALQDILENDRDPLLSKAAGLALGIMGRQLQEDSRSSSQERALQIEQLALSQLRTAKGNEERRKALGVLGNLGPSQWKEVEAYGRDSDPEVRGSAYMALRFVQDPQLSLVLQDAFQRESTAQVRQDILQALSLRRPDALWFQALTTLVERGGVPAESQLQLARAAARHSLSHPEEVKKFLQLSLSKTQDPQAKASTESLLQLTQKRESVL